MIRIVFLLLFLGWNAAAQTTQVLRIETRERTISATIDEKYAITIFLKAHKWSEDHAGIYSVKGWYWYDSKKIKIPVVGIWDGALTLFHFSDANQQSRVLEFISDETDIYSQVEDLKRILKFEEKFTFDYKDGKKFGQWEKGNRKLTVATASDEDFQIAKTHEFLRIQTGKTTFYDIDLYAFGLYKTDFSLVGYYLSKNENRVLLSYEFQSRPYAPGMCGAGTEKGYVTLRLDGGFGLLSFETVETESCLDNIYSEENTATHTIAVTGKDAKIQKWKVDAKSAQITKVK